MTRVPDGAFDEVMGTFLQRYGPAHARGEEPCHKKLCFTATDRELLAEVLYALCLDDACWGVKLTIEPKDGMYLGRCFYTTEERAGTEWARHKSHPRLMCTIQDDDFTRRFRPPDAAAKASW